MREVIAIDEEGIRLRTFVNENYVKGTESIYKVPPTFYFDHRSRSLPCGIVVAQSKTYVEVSMTDDEVWELLNDADYYTKGYDGWEASQMSSIISSAKSTIKSLARQGVSY